MANTAATMGKKSKIGAMKYATINFHCEERVSLVGRNGHSKLITNDCINSGSSEQMKFLRQHQMDTRPEGREDKGEKQRR